MASFYTIMGTLAATIQAALAGITVDGATINPQAALGWPSVNVLQNVARGNNVPITVYDRKIAKDTTRWSPDVISTTVVPATLTSEISAAVIKSGQSVTISLGGTVTPGDAVSAVLSRPSMGMAAQVAIGGTDGTPATVAAALASQINADPVLGTWISAGAAGSLVTLTNITPVALTLASYTGNGGTQVTEVGRRDRGVQVVCWARTQAIRAAVVDVISGIIANAAAQFGLSISDGTVARLSYVSDYDLEDDTLEDVYRHDFMISLEYGVTTTDQLFAVLAPIVAFQVVGAFEIEA